MSAFQDAVLLMTAAHNVAVARGLGDFDEEKHPRDDHGKFTSGGGGSAGQSGEKKGPPPKATAEQAKLAHDMKLAGASAVEIQAATGLTKQQAIKIVWKMNKAQKAEKAKLLGKQQSEKPAATPPPAPASTTPIPAAPATPPAGGTESSAGSLSSVALTAGYTWQEKTPANSPGMQPSNQGKFAWFKDGTQVSPPAAKHEQEHAAGQMHFGAGPKSKEKHDAEVAAAKAESEKSAKAFAEVHGESGKALGSWPIHDSVDRRLGSNYPDKVLSTTASWRAGLSSAEREAIGDYTSSDYTSINSVLRGKTSGNSHTLSQINSIKTAIAKSPAPPPPELVWRGVSSHDAVAFTSSLKPGTVVSMKGFQSTSIKPEFAASWSHDKVLFEIKPAKGAYVRPLSSHSQEYEYLLPHDAKYIVHGKSTVKLGGMTKTVIKLEMHG